MTYCRYRGTAVGDRSKWDRGWSQNHWHWDCCCGVMEEEKKSRIKREGERKREKPEEGKAMNGERKVITSTTVARMLEGSLHAPTHKGREGPHS
jgi:hypothetical protein